MILTVGDSLGVGSDPFLRERVAHVRTNSRGGRTAREGLRLLRGRHPRVLVFALGTNDADPAAYGRILRRVRRENPTSCLIFVSIYRHGAVRSLNRRQRAVPGALIAPWAHYARRYVGSDGVHADISGYKLRARLIAARIRACNPDERTL